MRITPAWAGLGLATLATGLLLGTPATADPTDPGSERPTAVEALAANPDLARAADGQAFSVDQVMTDADGTTHVRVQRTYRGLEVVGGDMVVHQAVDGTLEGVSQSLERALALVVKPRVRGSAAERTSLAGLVDSITGVELLERATLLIDATGTTPKLAWRVITGGMQANGTPSRLATYVDARTGQVIREEQEIVNVEGSGHTLYSGTVDLQVSKSGSSYRLTDPVHGNATVTDMGNRTDGFLCTLLGLGCTNGSTISSSDTVFGNGTTSDRQSAAADAAYGHAQTYDYFKQVHGRNGIFGDGSAAPSRVHYGNKYVNAFWDGEKMTYGDGDGVNFGPLVSLDVSGHEMSHGVIENTANLTYSGESGGLNEATADIFGTMVEFHANNSVDRGDYYIGEQFDLKDGVGFRRMDRPSADGNSQDCWTTGTKNLDVHYSSGVGNHFFYLLAEGSGAKTIGGKAHNSPTCDGSTVAGIGRDKAAAIWFRALTTYFTSSTNYAQARTATLSAAEDLYGAGSAEHAAVAAAWTAVGVIS